MPWRWDRKKYPEQWEEMSYSQRASTGWTCEFCGYQNGQTKEGKKGSYTVNVAAAHKWPNDEANENPELYTLCQGCHRSYDNQFRDIIEEGKHQASLHEIALQQEGYEKVWCDHPDCKGYYYPHEH